MVQLSATTNSDALPGPFGVYEVFAKNRTLIARLTRREIEARYRGSVLGVVWALLIPLVMLAIYTFVFSVVFQSRWGQLGTGRGQFSVILFSGLILFNIFSECLNRAPNLMLGNVAYIKKVVFPLEILPCVTLLVALFNAMMSIITLAVFYAVIFGAPPWTILLLPIVVAPLILLTAGLTWFLSSVGVYLRDVGQFVGVVVMMLMFMSPIFYPLESLPAKYRDYLFVNPLTSVLEWSKQVIFSGEIPNPWLVAAAMLVGWVVAWLGYAFFMKTRKGFADVI